MLVFCFFQRLIDYQLIRPLGSQKDAGRSFAGGFEACCTSLWFVDDNENFWLTVVLLEGGF